MYELLSMYLFVILSNHICTDYLFFSDALGDELAVSFHQSEEEKTEGAESVQESEEAVDGATRSLENILHGLLLSDSDSDVVSKFIKKIIEIYLT